MGQDYRLVPLRGDVEEDSSADSRTSQKIDETSWSTFSLRCWSQHKLQKVCISLGCIAILALAAFGGYLTGLSRSSFIREVPFMQSSNSTNVEVYDIPALQAVCVASTWNEGLYFVCDDNPGGIGNIMSLVLNCVRYAIAAGASITLPLIEKRGQDLTALKNGVQEPMSYFFDDAFFRGVMALNCPQMTVLEDISQIREFGNAHVTDSLRPSELHADNGRLDMHTSEFQHALSGWLNFEPSLHHPAIIRLSLGLFEWPISEESVEFYATFGKLLRFREDVHQLANDILRTIQRQSSDNGRFLGAHLRTEADIKGLWIDYNDQRDAYFAKALSMTFKTIYLASGDLIDSARLKTEAAKRNIKVLTKRDLLSRANLRKLTSMTWDQQGLVDYLVLKNSTFFMGSSPSSFAFALAYSRHLNIADESYPFPEDSLSKIIGEDVNFFRDGMWPVQG